MKLPLRDMDGATLVRRLVLAEVLTHPSRTGPLARPWSAHPVSYPRGVWALRRRGPGRKVQDEGGK